MNFDGAARFASLVQREVILVCASKAKSEGLLYSSNNSPAYFSENRIKKPRVNARGFAFLLAFAYFLFLGTSAFVPPI